MDRGTAAIGGLGARLEVYHSFFWILNFEKCVTTLEVQQTKRALRSRTMLCRSLLVLPIAFALGTKKSPGRKFLLIGGTGKIGQAVASHLLSIESSARIVLAGRNQKAGEIATVELRKHYPDANVDFHAGDFSQRNDGACSSHIDLLKAVDCVIHTAGPYADCAPIILKECIKAGVAVYVDVSDPLPYLERGLLLDASAKASGTTALLAAGAFPGMSNVLAMETAQAVMKYSRNERVGDIGFNYFTAGLGGSGTVNLYITNKGFGDYMGIFVDGELEFRQELPGQLLGAVDFFLENVTIDGNQEARERVGTKRVFAWPFPEAATVPTILKSRGATYAAMGTAPDAWNGMLGLLVSLVPRRFWRNDQFSQFLADFSEPLVKVTDTWLRLMDPKGIGETHSMRIDVKSVDGSITGSSVQAHDSFRQCVAQSCAEFALDCLAHPQPGVALPEQRYRDNADRLRIIQRITNTPGTFCYTGPVIQLTAKFNQDDLKTALKATGSSN